MSYYKVKFLSGKDKYYKAETSGLATWEASKDGHVCSVAKVNLWEIAGVSALITTMIFCGVKLYLMVG